MDYAMDVYIGDGSASSPTYSLQCSLPVIFANAMHHSSLPIQAAALLALRAAIDPNNIQALPLCAVRDKRASRGTGVDRKLTGHRNFPLSISPVRWAFLVH